MGNPNTELLTWAVENITEWNDDYTHLRSDEDVCHTGFNVVYSEGAGWYLDQLGIEWFPGSHCDYETIRIKFHTPKPQVITKLDWESAKLAALYRDFMQTPLKTSCKPQEGHIHAQLMLSMPSLLKRILSLGKSLRCNMLLLEIGCL